MLAYLAGVASTLAVLAVATWVALALMSRNT